MAELNTIAIVIGSLILFYIVARLAFRAYFQTKREFEHQPRRN